MNRNIRCFNVLKMGCLGLRIEFLMFPTKILRVLYPKYLKSKVEYVPGTAVLEDVNSCCTLR